MVWHRGALGLHWRVSRPAPAVVVQLEYWSAPILSLKACGKSCDLAEGPEEAPAAIAAVFACVRFRLGHGGRDGHRPAPID